MILFHRHTQLVSEGCLGTGQPAYEQDMYDVSYSELPSVDDLEVAAAAAAAAMDADDASSRDDTESSSEDDKVKYWRHVVHVSVCIEAFSIGVQV